MPDIPYPTQGGQNSNYRPPNTPPSYNPPAPQPQPPSQNRYSGHKNKPGHDYQECDCHPGRKVLILSQETACEWLDCIIKLGVVHGNKFAYADDIADNTGIEDLNLPTEDGEKLFSLSHAVDHDWTIKVLVDQCTSCGRKIIQYWKLLEEIIESFGDEDACDEHGNYKNRRDEDRANAVLVKVSSSCFCRC